MTDMVGVGRVGMGTDPTRPKFLRVKLVGWSVVGSVVGISAGRWSVLVGIIVVFPKISTKTTVFSYLIARSHFFRRKIYRFSPLKLRFLTSQNVFQNSFSFLFENIPNWRSNLKNSYTFACLRVYAHGKIIPAHKNAKYNISFRRLPSKILIR